VNVLVEGFGADAVALARYLTADHETVRLAGPEDEPPEAPGLRALGIAVAAHTDLDIDPGEADVAYLDPWTPETASRVERLRARGVRLSCLGDLLLERWPGPSVGITGTAGKTSTTALTAEILRAAGIEVAVSRGARAGNLWPTGDLLERLDGLEGDGPAPMLLLELTSSHLAFMHSSPTVAAVISFWPDHIELHGSLARYRAAKEAIVRHQTRTDQVVVNADDESASFADLTPGSRFDFSVRRRVENGAYLDAARRIVAVRHGVDEPVGALPQETWHPANLVAAAAIATAAGATVDAIGSGISTTRSPPWRSSAAGTLAGVAVIDDGMAATPSKTAALLRSYPDKSVILIAGGSNHAGGGLVHAAPEEQTLFERACDEIARAACFVITFGHAAPRLRPCLDRNGVDMLATADLEDAVEAAALRAAANEARAVVFSPLFPVSLEDRERFRSLIEERG